MEEKRKVAAYCRVGTLNQLGLEQQRAYLQTYAQEHGYEIVAEISDLGVAGVRNKAAIDRLINHPALEECKHLLCHSPNKLSRDAAHFAYAMEQMKNRNVSVTFAQIGYVNPKLLHLHEAVCEAMRKLKQKK